jgi:hypothetical protein
MIHNLSSHPTHNSVGATNSEYCESKITYSFTNDCMML